MAAQSLCKIFIEFLLLYLLENYEVQLHYLVSNTDRLSPVCTGDKIIIQSELKIYIYIYFMMKDFLTIKSKDVVKFYIFFVIELFIYVYILVKCTTLLIVSC